MALKHILVGILLVLAVVSVALVYVEMPAINIEQHSPNASSPIQTELIFSQTPRVNETMTVTMRITAAKAASNVTVAMNLSEGLVLTEGNLTWTGDLEENETVEVNVTVKPTQDTLEVSGNITTPSSEVGGPMKIFIEHYNSTHMIKYNRDGTTTIYPRPPRIRSYEVWLGGDQSTYPEPRKGTVLTAYFNSLDLTEDFYYVVMQFEGDGPPTDEQIQTLEADGIKLFEWHGDYTYYAKVPRSVLETTSYDFVRWIGIPEQINATWKIADPTLKEMYYENFTGPIKLSVALYQKLDDNQYNSVNEISRIIYYGSPWENINVEINSTYFRQFVNFNFVERIWIDSPIVTMAASTYSEGIKCN